MRCDVLAVGTELLLGQITNSNAAEIAEMLASNGIDSYEHVTVGDNIERIASAMKRGLVAADALIVTGGLGPTHDDVTREAVAQVMGVALVHDEAVATRIREVFAARGREMADNNLRQAQVPVGAQVIEQINGTAPGLICPIGEKVMYLLPGVPYEMREMMSRAVLPDLRARSHESEVIVSRMIRTWGISESTLASLLEEHIDALEEKDHATVAFIASGDRGVGVRVTAKAANEAEAQAIIAKEEQRIFHKAGKWIYGTDEETLESVVAELVSQRGLSIGVAESLTAGMVCARLANVAGASAWLRGGIVSYASDLKFSLLNVPEGPVVNEATARAMAEGVCRTLNADVGIATTGVAGPAEQEGQKVGTVFVGACVSGEVTVEKFLWSGSRERIRQMATSSALDSLRRVLLTTR